MSEKGVSVQEAYMEIGGFGKITTIKSCFMLGLFHLMASILLIMGFGSGQYVT